MSHHRYMAWHLTLCGIKRKISCNVRQRQRRPTLEALRRARIDAGLTISELAKRAGVSRDTISHAERGRHSLQGPTLSKIARALGRAPSELLAEEERLAPKAPRRSSREPSLFNGLEDAAQSEALQKALGVLFQGLTRRGQAIVDQSLREGPSEALSQELKEYYAEVAALHRLKGRRDIFGRDSDELAEAEAAYQEVEARIQAMTQQDVEATEEERSHFRKFREKRKNQRREEPKADAS